MTFLKRAPSNEAWTHSRLKAKGEINFMRKKKSLEYCYSRLFTSCIANITRSRLPSESRNKILAIHCAIP